MNNVWWDKEDDKMRVNFSISLYGKTHEFNGVYEDGAAWPEVINDLIKTVESSYGYTFEMGEDMGIYYQGKDDVSE